MQDLKIKSFKPLYFNKMKEHTPKPCKNPNCDNLAYSAMVPYCGKKCKDIVKPANLKLKSPINNLKSCKGTTEKTFGFGCEEKTEKRIFGLGLSCGCYKNWLLNSNQGSKYLQRVTLKVTSPRVELEQAFTDKKERTKLTYLLFNVRNICHEYIRLRDKGLPCISCGGLWQPSHQSGHFYKSELYSNLRYTEENLAGQCEQCNMRNEGNESGYRAGIIQRYGKEHLDFLDNKAKDYKKNDFHWDRETLNEIRKYYQEKLKELKLRNSK